MSATASSSKRVVPRPEVLRQNIAEHLQRLSDESLVVLHDLMLDIELRQAWHEFSNGVGVDWAAGKHDRLDEALREARESLRATSAP
jgi:hypothetical protein